MTDVAASSLLLAPERYQSLEGWPDQPLALVDVDGAARWTRSAPPPYPVIGVGRHGPTMPNWLDCIIEPPIRIDAVIATVSQAPLAAAAAVRLLRAIDGVRAEAALTLESATYAMLQGSAEHLRWRSSTDRPVQPAGRVLLERRGSRLTITLDRPAAGNAIDRPMRDALAEAFALARLDPELDAVSLRANGKAFSLGADLAEFGTTVDPATAHAIRARTLPAWSVLACSERLDVHVDGACIGAGLELAAFAQRFTATSRAWFQLPELAMGIIPGAGGCVSVPARIGRQRTAALLLSGQRLGARDALRWGLIDAVVDQPA